MRNRSLLLRDLRNCSLSLRDRNKSSKPCDRFEVAPSTKIARWKFEKIGSCPKWNRFSKLSFGQILRHKHGQEQDKVNYAVSEREDGVTDLTTLRRMTGCTGMYWAVLGSNGVLDFTRLHWDLIDWFRWTSNPSDPGGLGGPGGQDDQHR